MSQFSLNSSLRHNKVDSSSAERTQSSRFLQSQYMVCPKPVTSDVAGRAAKPDTLNTSTAGCSAASSRLRVENAHRPVYSAMINLAPARGIHGKYGVQNSQELSGITGNAGVGLKSFVR